MTWTVVGPSRDFRGSVEYVMQDGWFWDEKRNSKDGSSYYLFSPDGISSYAEGLPGFTVASNLPELFFTTSNGDPSSGSFERVGSRGDDVQLILGPKLSFISGIPDHYYTGKSAGTQTLSSEIEALYWEGSYHDDSFAINIDSADTSIRSVFYWGESGNDTVTISGTFQALDGQHKYADQHPTDISNAFAGGEGFDRLIIDANSYEGFYISYLENENGFMGRGQELSTRFEIEGPHGGSYMAVDVEEVVFLDKTFSRYNMVLASANSSSSFLVGTEEDNYISGTEADDRVESGAGNDFIFTGDGDDVVDSGSGDDVIVAASGNGDDFYNGGKGFDVATYTSSQKSLKINLKKGVVKGGLNGEDSLKSIEGIVGTYYSDSIIGNKASNQLDGHKGNDRLFGDRGADFLIGGAGNDYIHGGAGIDTAQFSKRHNRINLNTSKKQNTRDGNDRLISIENVNSGSGNDVVVGNKAANRLNGQKGNDRLYGGGGRDLLIGGGGKDKVWGQGGRDTFLVKRGAGYTVIKDFFDGDDRIQLGSGRRGLDFKSRGDDLYIYQRKDLLAIVEDVSAGDVQLKGNYLI